MEIKTNVKKPDFKGKEKRITPSEYVNAIRAADSIIEGLLINFSTVQAQINSEDKYELFESWLSPLMNIREDIGYLLAYLEYKTRSEDSDEDNEESDEEDEDEDFDAEPYLKRKTLSEAEISASDNV